MKRILSAVCLIAFLPLALIAQDNGDEKSEKKSLELPECDIFLFKLLDTSEETKVSDGFNFNNRKGYDNQPWFTPDSSSILFSANGMPDRTDVFEYQIESKETKQLTDDLIQQYSPQVSPDNKTLSFVVDGEKANQSIWSVDRDGESNTWLLKNQGEREPVGYYSWNHKTDYILYWSRYGFSMRLVHRTKPISHYVTGDAIPATPLIIPGTDNFSFVHQQGNGEVWIKELNPETLAVRPLTPVVGSNRSYAWTPGGRILMCDGSKLHRWSSDSIGWEQVVDLGEHGMKNVSRVAVSPDGKRLAVVGLSKED
jgi:dipeptidyl aminopeptidase/acylaminoacyl peptidase